MVQYASVWLWFTAGSGIFIIVGPSSSSSSSSWGRWERQQLCWRQPPYRRQVRQDASPRVGRRQCRHRNTRRRATIPPRNRAENVSFRPSLLSLGCCYSRAGYSCCSNNSRKAPDDHVTQVHNMPENILPHRCGRRCKRPQSRTMYQLIN